VEQKKNKTMGNTFQISDKFIVATFMLPSLSTSYREYCVFYYKQGEYIMRVDGNYYMLVGFQDFSRRLQEAAKVVADHASMVSHSLISLGEEKDS